jgi:hypothetical protein
MRVTTTSGFLLDMRIAPLASRGQCPDLDHFAVEPGLLYTSLTKRAAIEAGRTEGPSTSSRLVAASLADGEAKTRTPGNP